MKNKSTEQLESNLNSIKGITIVLIFTITLLIGITVYGLLTKEDKSTFIALLTVGISCCAILPLQFINMKKIKSELNSRKENN
jgi:FtsH-binding integral membrane protein